MEKKNITYNDGEANRCRAEALVLWGIDNRGNKRRYAYDGKRWYYQPTRTARFVIISKSEVPEGVRKEANAK